VAKDKQIQEIDIINNEANEEAAQDFLRLKLNEEASDCDEDDA